MIVYVRQNASSLERVNFYVYKLHFNKSDFKSQGLQHEQSIVGGKKGLETINQNCRKCSYSTVSVSM